MREEISLRQLLTLMAAALTAAALRLLPGASAAAAGGEGGWLAPLAALPGAILLAAVLWDLLSRAPEGFGLGEVYRAILGKGLGQAVLLLYMVWMVLILAMGIVQCGERLSALGYEGGGKLLFLGAALLLTGRAAMGKLTAFARAVEICFLLLGCALGVVLLLAVFRVKPGNLLPLRGNILRGAWPVLETVCAAVPGFFLLGKVPKEERARGRRKTALWLLVGAVVLLTVHVVCFGGYGWETVQDQRVPFYEAAKQAGLPGAFQRAEAAAAAVLFLSDGALFGCTLYIVREIGGSMSADKKERRELVPLAGVLGALLAFLAGREPKIAEVIGQEILPWMSAGLGVLVPVTVWVLSKGRRGERLSCGREGEKTEDIVDGKETAKRSEKNGKKC